MSSLKHLSSLLLFSLLIHRVHIYRGSNASSAAHYNSASYCTQYHWRWFFMRKKIGFTIYVILSQLCVNCRADADAVILHHNSGLGDMITILTMHCAMMHHYLTVHCIIFNCSTSMHCEPLCSISSSALLATDELFICTVSIYV